jgi:hypothetical protein
MADACYGGRVGDRAKGIIRRAETAGGYHRDLGPKRRETKIIIPPLRGGMIPVIHTQSVGQIGDELPA